MAFVSGPVPECFEREVTATLAEFERDLRKAWPDGVERQREGVFHLRAGELRLEIELRSAGVRRLGLMALPRLVASYRFAGGDEPARRRMLAALDRAMQRGGG